MWNSQVLKNQLKSANQVDSEYSVTVSGAGATCVEKPKLKALLPGFRLHFLRYALFPKDNPYVQASRVEDRTDDNFTLSDVDASNGNLTSDEYFIVARTPLSKGYVYLFNADDPNDFHELEVDMVGNLSHVIWGGNNLKEDGSTPKNCRKKEKATSNYMLIVKEESDTYKKYWIGYSPVQWSYEYHDSVLNSSDEEKLQKQMILVECKGIAKGQEEAEEDVLPYNKVGIAYYKDEGKQRIKQTLRQVMHTEAIEEARGGNDIYEDMFISLNDPIGAADDIADELSLQIIKKEALLESIQTGRDQEEVFKRIRRGVAAPKATEEEIQIGAMVNLALTQYKFIYDSDEMIDDYDGGRIGYGAGVYKPKLINILGVNERKEQREKIRQLQNILGNLLETDFFKNAYQAHENGSKLVIIEGKKSAIRFYKLLAIKPHLQDKAFDLKNDEEIDTQWDHLIIESLQEEGQDWSVYNVLNKVVDLDEETIEEGKRNALSEKIASFIRESLEAYSQFAMEDVVIKSKLRRSTKNSSINGGEGIDVANKTTAATKSYLSEYEQNAKVTVSETVTHESVETITHESVKTVNVQSKLELTVKRLNKIHVYGEDMFEVRGYEVRKKVHEGGWRIDDGKVVAGKYAGEKDVYRWVQTDSPALVLKETAHGHHVFDIPVTKEVEKVIKTQENVVTRTEEVVSHTEPTIMGTKVKALLDGAPFRGVVALLQVFNIGAAMRTFSQEPSFKHFGSFVGVAADLTSATSYFLETALKTIVNDSAITSLGKFAAGANIVGSGVTVVMCTWDACLCFNARDNDAGLAWSGAAAAFSVVTAEAVSLFVGGGSFGPWGWVAGGVGAGLVFLAYYLTDKPIEMFFKNNALSDQIDFARAEEDTVGMFNKKFYNNRNTLCPDTDYQKWNDFKFAVAHFTDLMVSGTVCFNVKKLINTSTTDSSLAQTFLYSKHETIKTGFIKELNIGICFKQFLQTTDQFACKFYFLKDGFGGECKEMEMYPDIEIEEGNETMPPIVKIDVKIAYYYTKQYTQKSKILLACALSLGDGQFYPTKYNDETRLLGAYFSVYETITTTSARTGVSTTTQLDSSKIAIKPLSELKSGLAWNN